MRPLLYVLASVALLSVVACGSPDATEPESSPTLVPTPTDHAAIRDIDFESLPETVTLLTRMGSGRVATEKLLFTDLTGDMREEAIVPVTVDGTLGNIAYLVYTMRSGQPYAILTRTMDRSTASGLVMSIDDFGMLRETAGVYGNEDPLCCPGQLRLTTFRWDGTELQVAGEVREENPNKAKD